MGGYCMKTRQYILASILLLLSIYLVYLSIPGRYKYEFYQWFIRIGAPNFDTHLDAIEQTNENSVMDEFKRRGYKFKCFNHQCYARIKSAYDDIPAREIGLHFQDKKLLSICIEFPDSSFEKLNNYLNHRLVNYQKADQIPGIYLGSKDSFGKPLIVWSVNKGFIAASALPTPGEILSLRWINKSFISDSNTEEALTYTDNTLPPSSPATTSDPVRALNSDCKNAYTASVAYAVTFPNATSHALTLSDLIKSGYQPTKGVTTILKNLSDKGGTITCSGPDEWKASPAVITITDGIMNMTSAAAMSSSMLDQSPPPEQAPLLPPEPVAPLQPPAPVSPPQPPSN